MSCKHCIQLNSYSSDNVPYYYVPPRAHADEASAKNISSAHLVHDNFNQTSRDDLMKRLQLLVEQEAKFIADMKYVLS